MEDIFSLLEQVEAGNNLEWSIIWEQIQAIGVLIQRVVVWRQLVAITLALFIALFLSRIFRLTVNPKIITWVQQKNGLWNNIAYLNGRLISYVLFPIIWIILGYSTTYIFDQQGWSNQLLFELIDVLWFLLIYRLFMTIFYILFNPTIIHSYHLWFFMPFIAIIISLWILTYLINLQKIAGITVIYLFSNPISMGALLAALFGFYFWSHGTSIGQDVSRNVLTTYTTFNPSSVEASLTIIRYVLLAIGMSFVLTTLGVNATNLAFIGGGLSVGIGFALKEVLSNFISGIILMFEQALRPGDIIKVDDELGIVRDLNIRSTTVRTLNNVEIIVPNQIFLTDSVTTYTKTDNKVRVLIPVGVSYNCDPEQIETLLLGVANEHIRVQKHPAPKVFFEGFGDSSVDFELAVWLNNPALIKPVSSDLRFMIWRVFAKHNIEIPFPQQDLHIRSGLLDKQLVS